MCSFFNHRQSVATFIQILLPDEDSFISYMLAMKVFRRWKRNIIMIYHEQKSKDGNGTLLYHIVSRRRKMETEHYYITSAAEVERW